MFLFSTRKKYFHIRNDMIVLHFLSKTDSDLFSALLIPECMDKILYLEFLSIVIYHNLNLIISGNLNSIQP